jgi:hypothetical protein
MTSLKFHYPQTDTPAEQLKERLKLARLYVALTHAYFDLFYPKRSKTLDLEMLLVQVCVFIADAEGGSTSVTKIASHSRLSRATVYRRLEQLCKLGKIVKKGRSYYFASNAVALDNYGKLDRILRTFLAK